MKRGVIAGLILLKLLAPPGWAQPSSNDKREKIEKIEEKIKELEESKGEKGQRHKDPKTGEPQGTPNPDLDSRPEYPNPGAIVPETQDRQRMDGQDKAEIFPQLGPPPAGAKNDGPPGLLPANEDPVEAAVSEALLPVPKQPAGVQLNLAECLDRAFHGHPELKRYIQDIVQAEAKIRIVDASYLPILDITGDRTRDQDPTIEQDTTIQLNLVHTVWDGGQRSKQLKSAQAAFRAAVRNFQANWIDRTQQVTAAYIAVLQAEYFEAIQADNLARTDLNYSVSNAFYQGGLKSMIDVSTARVQQAQAQVSLVTAQNNVKTARVGLAQAVGIPLSEAQRPLDVIPVLSTTQLPNRDAAMAYLETYHPALTSLTDQAESNFATAQAARRANAPVFTANLYYGNIGINFPNAPIWQFQLALDFPFYKPSIGPTGDASDAAGHSLLRERENQQLLLLQQLDSAIANMEGARERAGYAVQGVRQALFNADIADRRYKVGLSDITEVINARGFVESTRTDLITALVDLKNAENLFYQAMGQVPLPPGLPADTPLLQQQIDEMPARDKALEHKLPPPEPPVNQR